MPTPEQLLGVDSGGLKPPTGNVPAGSATAPTSGAPAGPASSKPSQPSGPAGAEPSGGPGSGPAGGAAVAAALHAPQVTEISPLTGMLVGGNLLTIHGRHFTRDAKVYFNTLQVRQVTWLNSRSLQVVVPAARSVDLNDPLAQLHGLRVAVRVVTAGGESAVGVSDVYTYL